MNKAKRIGIVILISVILLILLVLSLVPQVASVESVAFDPAAEGSYPGLHRAYQELCGENGAELVTAEACVEVVTVKNLWSSWDYYILPCYVTEVKNVPRAGETSWRAALHVLSVCSKENSLLARLCGPKIRDFSLRLEPGEDTFVSSVVDVFPGDITVEAPACEVSMKSAVRLTDTPEISVSYRIGTAASAAEREEEAAAIFVWSYEIYLCGKPVRTYHTIS